MNKWIPADFLNMKQFCLRKLPCVAVYEMSWFGFAHGWFWVPFRVKLKQRLAGIAISGSALAEPADRAVPFIQTLRELRRCAKFGPRAGGP